MGSDVHFDNPHLALCRSSNEITFELLVRTCAGVAKMHNRSHSDVQKVKHDHPAPTPLFGHAFVAVVLHLLIFCLEQFEKNEWVNGRRAPMWTYTQKYFVGSQVYTKFTSCRELGIMFDNP